MGRDTLELLLVMLGGGLGSALRFLFGKYGNPLWAHFPMGTFLANALSCLVLGFFSYWVIQKSGSGWLRPLVMVGFCGGFSTFSTFSAENLGLLQSGNWRAFVLYAGLSLVAGLLFLLAGARGGQAFFS